MAKVSTEVIASLAQYYDQPLRCFTFGDFQLSPMVEEFEEILGCPLGGRKPYLFSGFYPSLAKISKIVQISAQELDHRKQVKNGVVGIPRNCLEAKARILAGFPNVPLMGTKGCISYNSILVIRQLGYPMRGAPLEEELAPIIARGFNKTNMEALQKVRKAWEMVQKKDKELKGSNNGPIGGYRKWLKAHMQGLDWLLSLRTTKGEEVEALEEDEEVQALRAELEQAQTVKERFKSAAIKIRKENAELRDVNIATTKALEQKTKRTRREEHGQNKFRGALWGNNSKLKLQREERDQSRVDSLILKDKLKVCLRSKRSLSQCLCKTETNMLAIVSKYQEELNLATAHEHKVADEYARVYAEKEARGRVIDSLHQEATMWMDQCALTLNGSQELPRLLAKAKAMADTYSAPEEIHRLLGYCQHMIDLMTHIIRNC
uniref:DUF7745 domain-containing protein n=1 Tax=Glycine max TaxID=3847 RepID=D3G9M2_SOYBN|nr:unknown protein [Glycine max]